MRKKKDKDKKPNLRSILYTSKYFNNGKGEEVKQLLRTMSNYKNMLSKYGMRIGIFCSHQMA